SEKSMGALELKKYLCAIHNHVNLFDTAITKMFSALKEDVTKETGKEACLKCGVHQVYVSVLLGLSSSYLTKDESLFDKIILDTGSEGKDGKGVKDEERHAFMLNMYVGAMVRHIG